MKEKQATLYIHIPFCQKKCFYCSFVVSANQENRIDDYLLCLDKEAANYKDKSIASVYVGGGTPTLLNCAQLRRLKEIIEKNFCFRNNCEFTVECNPESIDEDKAKLLFDLGVNRVSLGVQTLDNSYLDMLGRCHDSKSALKAYGFLRKAGFKNINLDFMFCLPGQSKNSLRQSLSSIMNLESDHLSLYALTIEKNSKFYVNNFQAQNEQVQAENYIMVVEDLEGCGFKQYEISNFALPGKESQHNLHYWHGGNYIGLGVGAHSHFSGYRSWNINKLPEYIRRVGNSLSPKEGDEYLSASQRLMERVLFGLRMNCGINVDKIEAEMEESLGARRRLQIEEFVKDGFLYWEEGNLKTRLKGRVVLDEISARLI